VDGLLAWLTGLPPLALYAALAIAAAAENIFPPLPSDTVVAFGSFLAARGQATPFGAWFSTWAGNVAGAMLVYAAARRFGAEWLHRRIRFFGGEEREHRLERLYRSRGPLALFLSRFLPGVRALVPPFAGALRVPAWPAFLAIAAASGIWYGVVTVVAYRVGSNWEALQSRLAVVTRNVGIVAVVVVAIAAVVYLVLRRRRRER
jgi:membrane protein DedA with SNARE-associated domain